MIGEIEGLEFIDLLDCASVLIQNLLNKSG